MPRKKLTEQESKEIKLLQAQNAMYEKTKEEAKIRGVNKSLHRIEIAQKDGEDQIRMMMGDTPSADVAQPKNSEGDDDRDIFEILQENAKADEEQEKQPSQNATETTLDDYIKPDDGKVTYDSSDANAAYDIIPLPSKGECYKDKVGRIPVGYLTAYDENLITSPNLYRDGLVIDLLLKNKVLDKSIDVDKLVKGDVDAIILFLRATSYGTDFPISVTDPKTGQQFSATVDLSTIKTKDFKLKADENGYFDYTLPKSGKVVKFKYLTRKDERDLRVLNEMENKALLASTIEDCSKRIKDAIKADEILDGKDKSIIFDDTKHLDKWAEAIREKRSISYNRSITNRMEMEVVAIDGVTDRKEIKKMIETMPANDSLHLRRYILDNEPGLDFEIEVQRPESLGGGSLKTFLEWDDTVFINLA